MSTSDSTRTPAVHHTRGGTHGSSDDRWFEDSIARQLALAAKSARAFGASRIADAGSTFGVWTILATLETAGPLIQRELAERLSIESPTLTRHLVRMEDRGLIERRRSDSDRRAATVELTAAGHSLYQQLSSVALDGNSQLLRGFTQDEISTLLDMLIRIQANARSADSAGHPNAAK